MRELVQYLITWLKNWWRTRRRLHRFKGVEFSAPDVDPSSAIRVRRLVIVGSPEKPKWLRFLCPCRCGEVVALNLMRSYSPRWSIELHSDGRLTLTPSV